MSTRFDYRADPESLARILLLIDAFSRAPHGDRELEGRVKLAKLDFLMRYPRHLERLLTTRSGAAKALERVRSVRDSSPIDSRMVRYRYGPWDPAYYAILGSLIGRGLVNPVPLGRRSGIGYRTSAQGARLAEQLRDDGAFEELDQRARDLRRHFDLTGTALKAMLYQLPEVSDSRWREEIE